MSTPPKRREEDAMAAPLNLDGMSRDELAGLLTAVAARLLMAPEASSDRLIDATEAGAILCVSPSWLRRRVDTLDFGVRCDGAIRFSLQGIQHYIERQRTG